MKTVHVDSGWEMQGGQWQVLYLVERLKDAVLMAPDTSPLFMEARKRGLDARALSFVTLFKAARAADLVHAHDSRSHTLAAIARGAPLVVSRRVGFPMKTDAVSGQKYKAARMYLAVSKFVAGLPGGSNDSCLKNSRGRMTACRFRRVRRAGPEGWSRS